MYKKGIYKILANEPLTATVWRMVLGGDTQWITAPGQFVDIALEGRYLRRPISVCDYDATTLTLIYKVVGEGTAQMSRMAAGGELDLLTGLGNGFDVHNAAQRPLLVGGGVGVPPLYNLAKVLLAAGKRVGVVLGFNTAEAQQAIAAALPYLESVEIKRRLPDTVVITATPAVETYTVESAAGWAVLSQSYKVLRVDAEAPAGLVRIDGAQADAPAPGQPVKFTEEDKLSVLQTVLSKAQAQGLGPISEVDLTNTLELSFLYQDRIRIVLGTTNDLDYKIKWAWEMVTPGQTSDSLGEEERGTLDVSSRGEDGLGRARWRAGVL